MATAREDDAWQATTTHVDRDRPDRDELLAPSTQIVANRDDYLGQGQHEVGRRIANDQVELFVSGDAPAALQREFVMHAPQFIALHDVGTSASLRLLAGVAGGTGSRVQRFSIRRQGHGMALAVLQFVDLTLADGSPVRVFSTDADADPATRAPLARVLLSFSRLGVLLVGELSPTLLSAQLQPISDAMAAGPWNNRELLMVPLGSGVALAAQAAQLGGHRSAAVHVTPHAGKTRQAWSYITGAWNRLHGGPGGEHTLAVPPPLPGAGAVAATATAASAAIPMPFGLASTQPTPSPSSLQTPPHTPSPPLSLQPLATTVPPAPNSPRPSPGALPLRPAPAAAWAPSWRTYVDSCAVLKGVVACCVFDVNTTQVLAQAGTPSTADQLAEQGARLLRTAHDATRALSLGSAPAEASVSTPSHHLLLRPVAGHPNVALHIVLANSTNLTLARMQLERVIPPAT